MRGLLAWFIFDPQDVTNKRDRARDQDPVDHVLCDACGTALGPKGVCEMFPECSWESMGIFAMDDE